MITITLPEWLANGIAIFMFLDAVLRLYGIYLNKKLKKLYEELKEFKNEEVRNNTKV